MRSMHRRLSNRRRENARDVLARGISVPRFHAVLEVKPGDRFMFIPITGGFAIVAGFDLGADEAHSPYAVWAE